MVTTSAPRPTSVSIETITPEAATEYLERNYSNRPLKPSLVDTWADSLRAGTWELNGSTIVLNGNRLMDGQHRLHAVVKTGISMTTVVVRNVDESVFDTIDIGRRRAAEDVFAIKGYKNNTTLAKAAREVWLYGTSSTTRCPSIPYRSLLQLVETHPDIAESVSFVGVSSKRVISSGLLAGYHFLFSQVDATSADRFVEDLVHGANLTTEDPVYLLRETLLGQLRSAESSARRNMSTLVRRALLIKAFNYRLTGRTLRVLRWGAKESFPDILLLPQGFLLNNTNV